MGSELLIQAALQLLQHLISAAVEFGRASGLSEDKIHEALQKELARLGANDPSQLQIPE